MKVLAVDCATEYCSAALWLDGALIERSAPPARGQSEQLLHWVAELLAEGGVSLRALDLIAFGRGPGAFTGVRMATSIAQGLAFSLGLPVAPVSTLRAVAVHALALAPQADEVLVCQDARIHEVYWARFARCAEGACLQGEEHLGSPTSVDLALRPAQVVAGSGFNAYAELAAAWQGRSAAGANGFVAPLHAPSRAQDIARLAAGDGLAAAVTPDHALPVYLRDDVAKPSVPEAL